MPLARGTKLAVLLGGGPVPDAPEQEDEELDQDGGAPAPQTMATEENGTAAAGPADRDSATPNPK